jgi:hypothetical protein
MFLDIASKVRYLDGVEVAAIMSEDFSDRYHMPLAFMYFNLSFLPWVQHI